MMRERSPESWIGSIKESDPGVGSGGWSGFKWRDLALGGLVGYAILDLLLRFLA